ncbi:hypothetical protein [Phenylobacterium sp.]|uniref:hypothetical protein n=1 Tax=Phenylobacterium sp. TaxID=1871053 RepID=UPI00301E33AA
MRLALSSLIVAAGLATAAQAQDPVEQPAPPPAAEPAPAAAPEPAPQPAPEPAPAPEPPPPLPTSGYGFEAIQVVEKICRPAVRGQSLEDLAKSQGFKLNRREQTWAKPFGGEGRNYQVILYPSGSNKSVCMADFRFPTGKEEEIAKAFNVWAFVQEPPLDPTANYTQPQDPDGLKRVRRSWEYLTATQSIGLNFSTVRNPDDSQVNKNYDLATVQYQERSF